MRDLKKLDQPVGTGNKQITKLSHTETPSETITTVTHVCTHNHTHTVRYEIS